MVVIAHKRQPKIRKIPAFLVYEELDGQALPYRGYLDVLSGQKKIEEIMGSSSLQSVIIFLINGFIFNTFNRKKYRIATNEAGLHIDTGDNLANDIAIFDKTIAKTLNDKYFNVPPKLVIEVDIKVDLNEATWNNELEYLLAKSQKMLDFGVEAVIWITTKSKKIFVISPTKNWYLANFDEDIPLLDGHFLNLGQLLAEEEIDY
jgi:Uma2 family endonuclease